MPRTYVACLASYNNGVLHGRWIDLDGLDVDDVRDEIAEMLRESKYPNVMVACPSCTDIRHTDGSVAEPVSCPTCDGLGRVPSAEEYAIHDYDELPSSFGEHPNLAELIEYAEMIDKHGAAWAAYVEYCGDIGEDSHSERHFEDCRAGEADSEEDWIEQYLDDTGVLSEVPENLRHYFDSEKYLRDMKLNGDVDFVEHEGTTYAFWRN